MDENVAVSGKGNRYFFSRTIVEAKNYPTQSIALSYAGSTSLGSFAASNNLPGFSGSFRIRSKCYDSFSIESCFTRSEYQDGSRYIQVFCRAIRDEAFSDF
jgi:hypothetical protein